MAARVRPYLLGLALVAAVSLMGWPIQRFIHPANLVMLYLAAVVVAALHLGRGPSVFASVLSVAAFDFFFVEPRFTFTVSDTEYILTFLGLLVVGVVISALVERVGHQVEAARRREAETHEVYSLSRDLAVSATVEAVAHAVATHIEQTFHRGAAALLPLPGVAGEAVRLAAHPAGFADRLDAKEWAVAAWVYEHGEAAGQGTDTLPAAASRYLPLHASRGVLGVIAVRPPEDDRPESPDGRRLLEAFVIQGALALERVQLAEQAGQVEVLSATEKIQTALLDSVSHELRTPLATITGVLSSLRESPEPVASEALRGELVDTAWGEAQRLNRLVGNLLDMSRLQAGALALRSEPCDIQDLAGVALEQLASRLQGRQVTVGVPADLPLAPLDPVLFVQVLLNLLDNALKYSPPGSPLEITARVDGGRAVLAVSDRGTGIPPQDLGHVFDKFQRLRHGDAAGGTGLGLAISKGIVEAHGGQIRAENRPGGGTTMVVSLPLDAGPQVAK